ncbi:MAG TPA: SPOR domain-containing protein [Allosphingosinicella sp.]|nr:SPOR domain-containing protein [Allosphingosinicella sp.]
MKMKTRAWLLAAACTLAGTAAAQPPAPAPTAPPTVAAPSVRAGIEAWAAENWPLAIANFRPLADRGDADAQYAMAQAYFLGRGVPQNSNLAEQWYERAARQGNEEAQANYGLLLFQNGRRREAMPWIERAAGRGDPRAQYVLGTALFNGDLVGQDLPRAYALMTRAAQAGLPPAISQLAAMEPHIPAADRARGAELARSLPSAPAPVQMAAATPPRVATAPASPPPPAPPQRIVRTPPVRIAERPPTPAPAQPRVAAAGGRWRIQLGAFSSEANARRAWSAAAGRLPGLQPSYVRAGSVVRVQAGPLPDRAAAQRACGAVGNGCFPVAP